MNFLQSQSEIKIKDIKKVVSHSSYYTIIIQKLYNINTLLREINPKFYLAEPTFSITKTKKVFTSLKRCRFLEIDSNKNFFILKFKNE